VVQGRIVLHGGFISGNFEVTNDVWVFSVQLQQWTRSEDYLRRAIAVAPNHPEAYFRLACVCAMAERESEALACLEGAVARGFNKIGHLRDDPTLAGLQQNERMQALIHGLAACG